MGVGEVMNFKAIICAGTLALGWAGATNAASVTFAGNTFVNQNGVAADLFEVTISDIAGGVNVDVALSSTTTGNGDTLLLGLEGVSLAGATYTYYPDPDTGDEVTAFCTTGLVATCTAPGNTGGGGFTGGAFQTNGSGSFYNAYGHFDTLFRIGRQGTTSGLNNGFSIDIFKAGISAMNFTVVGFRVQGVSGADLPTDPTDGSLKIYSDDPSVIPLPAAGWLLLGGLGGLAALKRRRG